MVCQAQKKAKYVWWERRLGRAFQLYDETRIDHFRGFAGETLSYKPIAHLQFDRMLKLQAHQAFGSAKLRLDDLKQYRRTSTSGTTFSGKKCLSGPIFHAI
jgi:hypothetical protein